MDRLKFYIDGAWVDPAAPATLGIVNPATEETFAQISLGSRQDVDRAAKAARRAFAAYSETSVEDRLAYLHKIIAGFRARLPELARMMTLEMARRSRLRPSARPPSRCFISRKQLGCWRTTNSRSRWATRSSAASRSVSAG
jgi:acyl-CoA reductase-like NAD-dependent aldehyde dehydrogenase